jgi:ribose transport system permease protein
MSAAMTTNKTNEVFHKILFFARNNLQVLGIVCMIIVFAVIQPQFLTFSNVMTIAQQIVILAIAAVGGGLVIMTGNIDLSVGSVVGLSSLVLALVMAKTGSVLLAIASALFTGIIVGILNGVLVARLGLDSIIVTIAALAWGRGIVQAVTRGQTIRAESEFITYLVDGKILGVAFPIFLIAFLYIIFYIFLHRTKTGYHVFALGSNEQVVINSGINSGNLKIDIFIIAGFLAAVGGIISIGRSGSALAITGQGLELDVIMAVVIGGNRLSGGMGSVFKVLLGVLFVGLLSNGLSIMAVPGTVVQMFQGLFIILAVLSDRLAHGREKST